jgi:hypothetical protein
VQIILHDAATLKLNCSADIQLHGRKYICQYILFVNAYTIVAKTGLYFAVHWNFSKTIMHDYICYDNTALQYEITKDVHYIYCSAVNL